MIGRIYKIYCPDNPEEVYIGSTTATLNKRFIRHKSNYKAWKEGKYAKTTCYDIFEKYSIEKCIIELIEEVQFEDKKELTKNEAKYIRDIDCVNKYIPDRTKAEWEKEYSVKNRDLINAKRRQRYAENKEKISRRRKELKQLKKNEKISSSNDKDASDNSI